MVKQTISFEFDVYNSIDELSEVDHKLMLNARSVTQKAYAPYSNFLVGAAALLENGEIVEGSNQENASFPVGICAERVLMSSAAMLFPNQPINTMAIAYHHLKGKSNTPVSPCGMCRQAIREFEERTKQPIKLILSGMEGEIYIIKDAKSLLPLSFNGEDLK